MKKFLSLLMALMLMLVPFAASARTMEDYTMYMTPDARYGFVYPKEWMVVARENIDEALSKAYAGGDSSLISLLEELAYRMQESELVMAIDPATGDRIEMAHRQMEGFFMPDEELLASMENFHVLMPKIDPNAKIVKKPELMRFVDGGHNYAVFMYTTLDWDGVPVDMVQALTFVENVGEFSFSATLYSVGGEASVSAMEGLEAMLASLTVM